MVFQSLAKIVAPLALGVLLLVGQQATAKDCPMAGQEQLLRRQIESSLVDLSDSFRKSGFVVKVGEKFQLVTAHHNVTTAASADDPETKASDCKKFAEKAKKDPNFSMAPWTPSQLRVGKFTGKHWGAGRPRETFQFAAEPGRFNYSADLVSAPSQKAKQGLEVSEKPPEVGEEIFVAGFPQAKAKGDRSKLVILKCRMQGYRPGVNTRESNSLALDCPGVNFDIGGMSGGTMVSACTGKVVGAVSGQDFDDVCPSLGNPTQVIGVPVGLGPSGDLELGLQRPIIDAQCISTTGTYGERKSALSRKCQVLPPGSDPSPGAAPGFR